jgi:hypothetical protein
MAEKTKIEWTEATCRLGGRRMSDTHRAAKLAATYDPLELDGWVAEARLRGDRDAEQAGITRRLELHKAARK